MHVLIIEDEQRAGEKLKDLITRHYPELSSLEWIRSVEASIGYLNTKPRLDIIFSDIELLDGNAFEIYKAIKPNCPIIFCTAYNQFFLDAFKTNGIGYLLKPYTENEFVEAIQKYDALFNKNENHVGPELLNDLQHLLNLPSKKYKQTFTVKKPTGIYLLQIYEIAYFQAQGDFIFAFDFENKKHILNYTLSQISELVDPLKFFQINRSEILGFNAILKYHTYIKNRLEIVLKMDKVALYTSNSRSSEFRSWIEHM